MTKCLNCNAEVSGKYCQACGQKTNISRLNAKGLLEEIGHFFTHIEKNFFYTTKEFILRPGAVAINYLKGKRKNYQKPISFFLIWAGLYIILHNLVINYFHYQPGAPTILLLTRQEQASELLRSHFTLFFLPVLFVSSGVIYFILARPKFYYFEVLVLCLYGAGCFNAFLIFIDLFLGVLLRVNVNDTPVFVMQSVISGLYNFWFCYDLFRKVKIKNFWVRIIMTSVLIAVLGMCIFFYFPLLWILLFK